MAKANTAVKEKNINLNKVNVTGRLVADIDNKTLKNGKFVHKLRIAINRTYRGKEMTSFIDVEMFSDEEKEIQLKKGQQVYIDGRVVFDKWEKDGKLYSKTKIQAFNIVPIRISGNDINTTLMSGRLVKDPIVVKVGEGRSAIKFRLAVNRNYQQDGEWKQVTEFIDVVQFGTTDYIAKLASKIAKGKFVYIQGYLLQESWETQSGEKRSKIVVVAEQINISVLLKKNNNKNNNDETDSSFSEKEIEEELESLDEIETPF